MTLYKQWNESHFLVSLQSNKQTKTPQTIIIKSLEFLSIILGKSVEIMRAIIILFLFIFCSQIVINMIYVKINFL